VQWSPRTGETVALAVLGVGLAPAVAVPDAARRVLVGAGALPVLPPAVPDVLTRPRLAAGPAGGDVRNVTGGHHLPWTRLRVRVLETRRLGMRSRTLELDTAGGPDDDGVLVVLGRRDLGTDPEAVARALREMDPTAR